MRLITHPSSAAADRSPSWRPRRCLRPPPLQCRMVTDSVVRPLQGSTQASSCLKSCKRWRHRRGFAQRATCTRRT